ncbi:hypothetical protein Cpir12675_002014 [Ceratocystis pirilliformis]|uniref:SEH-associated protein 4 n=1 Tax=Ceratocystis pirilliformis TaxID=259994 RepID=A0ABR3ZCA3_9PEZI
MMDRMDSGLVKWCPHPAHESFMHINLQHRVVQVYKPTGRAKQGSFDYQPISKYEDIPPLTTYDWSHTSPGLLAVGTAAGVVNLLRVDDNSNDYVELGLKMVRVCQAVAFNLQCKLAVGLERVRMDQCLHIWDLGHLTRLDARISGFQKDHSAFAESAIKLEPSVSVSSIRFFDDHPDTLVVGIKGQGLRIHDLRGPTSVATFHTKCNNNLAIDHSDQNYFASSALDQPGIMIWDRRAANKPVQSATYARAVEDESVPYGAALKLDRIVDVDNEVSISDSMHSDIRSLRFCRDRRGMLGILSRTGQLKVLQTNKERISDQVDSGGSQSAELLEVYKSHDMDVSRFGSGRKNDRIVSFDWVSLQNPVLRPRMLVLRANGKFDILEQPSNASNHLFNLVPWKPPHRSLAEKEPYHDIMHFEPAQVSTMLGPLLVDQALSEIPIFGAQRANLVAIMAGAVQPKNASGAAITDVDAADRPLPSTFAEATTVAGKLKVLRDFAKEIATPSPKSLPTEKEKNKPRNSGLISCREIHEELLTILMRTKGLPREAHETIDHVMLLRAKEMYLFNAKRNAEVVTDDPWLRNLWEWIADAEVAAGDTDMGVHPLDLSYLGVYSIWKNDLGLKPSARITIGGSSDIDRGVWERHIGSLCKKRRLPRYDGIDTQWPNHRQICLSICTWGEGAPEGSDSFHDVLPEFPTTVHTRAAARALFRGNTQQAVDLLKHASSKHPELLFVSLALQLMGREERSMAKAQLDFDERVASKTDPYLRAISSLIATGDWRTIANQKSLPLADRTYVAVRNLKDAELTQWLESEVASAAETGDIEGVVLTGLSAKMIEILAKYVAKFGDYQTATLVCAIFAPRYVDDFRAHAWRTAYRAYLQRYKAFLQRTKYDVESTKLSKRDASSRPGLKPSGRQIALRCAFCDAQPGRREELRSPTIPSQHQHQHHHHGSGSGLGHRGVSSPAPSPALVHQTSASPPGLGGGGNGSGVMTPGPNKGPSVGGSGSSGGAPISNPLTAAAVAAGISCPQCGRNLPRCVVCLEIVGMPRSDRPETSADPAVRAAARFPSFCLRCEHVLHLDHARQWFARMSECPVPECKCQCNFRANAELMYA